MKAKNVFNRHTNDLKKHTKWINFCLKIADEMEKENKEKLNGYYDRLGEIKRENKETCLP